MQPKVALRQKSGELREPAWRLSRSPVPEHEGTPGIFLPPGLSFDSLGKGFFFFFSPTMYIQKLGVI